MMTPSELQQKEILNIKKKLSEKEVKSYNEILSAREIQTKQRMEDLKISIYEKEMRECTFQPKITSVAQKIGLLQKEKSSQNPDLESTEINTEDPLEDENLLSAENSKSLPVYERLYKQKDKQPRSIASGNFYFFFSQS